MPKPIDLGRSISVSADPYAESTSSSGGGGATTAPSTPTDTSKDDSKTTTKSPVTTSTNNNDESDSLREELNKLQKQLDEEKWNSKQAAEYGLTLLEDYKKIQSRNYELEGEIETIKAELESTNLVFIFSILIC